MTWDKEQLISDYILGLNWTKFMDWNREFIYF